MADQHPCITTAVVWASYTNQQHDCLSCRPALTYHSTYHRDCIHCGPTKKQTPLLLPLLANNYLSSRLSPLLPSATRQHHCCLPRWPAITCHSTYPHGCLHSWQAAITSSVVSIAGQQPPTTMVVSIAEQQPLTHHRPCPHGWQAAMSFHNCIHY